MASRIDLSFFISLMPLLSPLEKGFVPQSLDSQHFNTIQLASLMPSSTCNRSYIVGDHKSSLEVIHKHGPCSDLYHGQNLNMSYIAEQVLLGDQLRAKHKLSILFPNESVGMVYRRFDQELGAASLPVDPGTLVHSYNGGYIVKVGLGKPAKSLSVEIDSGSDFFWTQCKPCKICYPQDDPIFDPSASSTYTYEPCLTDYCSAAGSVKQTCTKGTACPYHQEYFDKSYSKGTVARDTLTLSSDVIQRFVFGCGHQNTGLRGIAGMMGLGRGKTSIVEQTASKYNRLFSCCIPRTSGTSGYLIFGGSSNKAAKAVYTPLLQFNDSASSVYGVKVLAITIAGVRIPYPATTSTFLDTGFTLTVLPPTVYKTLRDEFRKHMAQYTLGPPSGDLDTCYRIIGSASTIKVPKISFSLDKGVEMDLPAENIFYSRTTSVYCLGFYGIDDKISILGNIVQRGFEVVHDISKSRIGIVSNAC